MPKRRKRKAKGERTALKKVQEAVKAFVAAFGGGRKEREIKEVKGEKRKAEEALLKD